MRIPDVTWAKHQFKPAKLGAARLHEAPAVLCDGGAGGPGGGGAAETETFRQPIDIGADGRDNRLELGLGGGGPDGPDTPGGEGREPSKLGGAGASAVLGRDGVGGEGAGGAGTAGAVPGRDDQWDPMVGVGTRGPEGGKGQAEGGAG